MNTPIFKEWLLRTLLALGCGLLLAFVFAPPVGAFLAWSRLPEAQALLEVRRGAAVLEQASSPGIEISDTLHGVIRWRLLFPALGRLLSLPSWALFGLAHVGALVVLGYVIALLRRRGAGWGASARAALVLGACSWFFASTGWLGYYDSWLAYGLLVLAFAEGAWPVWLACLWGPWVDERFVMAAPLALACRLVLRATEAKTGAGAGESEGLPGALQRAGNKTGGDRGADGVSFCGLWHLRGWDRGALQRLLGVPALLLAFYTLVRLGLLPESRGATPSGYWSAQKHLDAPLGVMIWGIWEGLRCGWLFAGAAVLLVWKRVAPGGGEGRIDASVRCGAVLLAALGAATLVVGVCTAQDFSRSMTMLLPLAVAGALLAVDCGARWLPRVLAVAAPVALLLPAHHVMSDRINPIYYLPHEIYVLANPPRALQPEHFELRGIHLMEQGDQAGAEAQLSIAIRLAPEQSGPLKHRGLLRAGQGRWREAREDFDAMTRVAPDDPEGWFMRAQSAAALGDAASARADLQKALATGGPEWAKRPDVQRFRARF